MDSMCFGLQYPRYFNSKYKSTNIFIKFLPFLPLIQSNWIKDQELEFSFVFYAYLKKTELLSRNRNISDFILLSEIYIYIYTYIRTIIYIRDNYKFTSSSRGSRFDNDKKRLNKNWDGICCMKNWKTHSVSSNV